MGAETEAKSICVHKLEDLLLDPMFTLFHVQHAQIASRTETRNSLIYHLKCSMTKVRYWNSGTIRDFCTDLVNRFPALNDSFVTLFSELQELTCKILNESSESSSFTPVREEIHTLLHSFMSACSDAFISHTHWFAVEETSTEYQSCKNNAKVRMQQANVVENTVMNFIKIGPKVVVASNSENLGSEDSQSPVISVSESQNENPQPMETSEDDSDSVDSQHSNSPKTIDLVGGVVKREDTDDGLPQFSTPFRNTSNKKTRNRQQKKGGKYVDIYTKCREEESSDLESSDSESSDLSHNSSDLESSDDSTSDTSAEIDSSTESNSVSDTQADDTESDSASESSCSENSGADYSDSDSDSDVDSGTVSDDSDSEPASDGSSTPGSSSPPTGSPTSSDDELRAHLVSLIRKKEKRKKQLKRRRRRKKSR